MKKSHLLLLLLGVGIFANSIAAPPQIPLTVTVEGDGTVMSEPVGITCPSDCDENYKKSTTVTLTATATANTNSSFLGWEGACVGTDPICVTKVRAPTFVTAMFGAETVQQLFPASGQTRCWAPPEISLQPIPCDGTGQDGDIQAGAPLSYTDNGDGTITDDNTRLMWEKKDASGGIHDQDNVYTFMAAFTFTDTLNNTCNGAGVTQCSANDQCGAGEVCGFAGYRDWRVPNVKELPSIVKYEGYPSVPAEFNSACVTGCTLTECSCTYYFGHGYWTSTAGSAPGYEAFMVSFQRGRVTSISTASEIRVRALRGGL